MPEDLVLEDPDDMQLLLEEFSEPESEAAASAPEQDIATDELLGGRSPRP